MSQKWFVRRGDQEEGPLTPQDLKLAANLGKVAPADFVRTGTSPSWRRASQVKGLFTGTREATTPITSPRLQPKPANRSFKFIIFLCGVCVVLATGFLLRTQRGSSREANDSPIAALDAIHKDRSKLTSKGKNVEGNPRSTMGESKKQSFDIARSGKAPHVQNKDDVGKSRLKERMDAEESTKRRAQADELFGRFSFQPEEIAFLSKGLKSSGATFELRGRDLSVIQRLHQQRDWLGLVKYLQKQPALEALPDSLTLRSASATLSDWDFSILVKTRIGMEENSDRELAAVKLLLNERPSTRYLHEITSYDVTARHPDGVGYLIPWRATGYAYGICVAQRFERMKFFDNLNADFRKAQHILEEKARLGELDNESHVQCLASEIERFQSKARIWIESH